SLQWILYRRRSRAKSGWKAVSFVGSTREVLSRCMGEKGCSGQDREALLAGLPPIFDQWRRTHHLAARLGLPGGSRRRWRARRAGGVGMTKRGAHRVAKLESALTGALQFGDLQADELARLFQLTARQRRALWRTYILLKQGKHAAAAAVMETECRELHDRE